MLGAKQIEINRSVKVHVVKVLILLDETEKKSKQIRTSDSDKSQKKIIQSKVTESEGEVVPLREHVCFGWGGQDQTLPGGWSV